MSPKVFQCKQCGNCCLNLNDAYCTVADDDDVKRWETAGREDILEYVANMEVEQPYHGLVYQRCNMTDDEIAAEEGENDNDKNYQR